MHVIAVLLASSIIVLALDSGACASTYTYTRVETPPPYNFIEHLGYDLGSVQYVEPGSLAQVTVAPNPSVYSEATNGQQSIADFTYHYMASGSSDALVPIDISFRLQTGSSGNSSAIAWLSTPLWNADGSQREQQQYVVCTGTDNSCVQTEGYLGSNSYAGDLYGYVPANQWWAIGLFSQANAGNGESFALADPQITILDPNYTLMLDPGVGNSLPDAVPEPATWAMMLLGFGAIATVLKRSRQRGDCPTRVGSQAYA